MILRMLALFIFGALAISCIAHIGEAMQEGIFSSDDAVTVIGFTVFLLSVGFLAGLEQRDR